MRITCVRRLVLVLVALVGCVRSNNDAASENITIREATRLAISEVMSREKIGGEKLYTEVRPNVSGWIVLVIEDSDRQAAFWHMHVSSTGEVSEFTGGE
jgi:hypothetical protein